MSLKSAFKSSLLNCQPIIKKSDGIVSTSQNPDDGYSGVNCGFAELIERQDGLTIERNGTEESNVSSDDENEVNKTYNVGNKKPEIILALQANSNDSAQENDFKRFATIIEESDYRDVFFDTLSTTDESLKNSIANRIEDVKKEIKKINSQLNELGNVVQSRNAVFVSTSFIKNKKRLNLLASNFRKQYYKIYSEDPNGSNIDISSTLLGFEDFYRVTNTSILYALSFLSVLPGSVVLETGAYPAGSGTGYERMEAPKIKYDVVSDFLYSLALVTDLTLQDHYTNIQNIFPSNTKHKIFLIAEALSYELTTTKGLKTTTFDSIFDVFTDRVGAVNPGDTLIDGSSAANSTQQSIINNLIQNNIAILEAERIEIGSNKIDGFVQGLIDSKIKDGTFDFSALENNANRISELIESYSNFIKRIRLLESQDNFFASQNLISKVCDGIMKALGEWEEKTSLSKNDIQFALLCQISNKRNANGNAAKRIIFKEIFNPIDKNSTNLIGARRFLLPSKRNDATVEIPRPEALSDIGTSKLVIDAFEINKSSIERDSSINDNTENNLFSISFAIEDEATKSKTKQALLKILDTQKNVNISFVDDIDGINASKLHATSLLESGLNEFYRLKNESNNDSLEAGELYGSNLQFADVSTLKQKFKDVTLGNFNSTFYTTFGATAIVPSAFDTVAAGLLGGQVANSFNPALTNNEYNYSINELLKSLTSSEVSPEQNYLSGQLEMNDNRIFEILKDSEGFSSIKREMISLYEQIYSKLDMQQSELTKNFKLNSSKIKFLIFELFISIMSLMNSTKIFKIITTLESEERIEGVDGRTYTKRSEETIEVFEVRMYKSKIIQELQDLKTLSTRKGSERNISSGPVPSETRRSAYVEVDTNAQRVSSYNLSTNFQKVSSAIGMCSNSSDLVASRIAQLQAISKLYKDSIGDFLKISTQKASLQQIRNNSKDNNIFLNLSEENIANKKLTCAQIFSGPFSIHTPTRINREYFYYSKVFEDKLKNNEAEILSVGIPTGMADYLLPSVGKEYFEIKISKRNLTYPDKLIKDTTFRFCKFLVVIPQISITNNLLSTSNNFIFLCYENGGWAVKNHNNAIKFVVRTTGLDIGNSKIIVINHMFDAMAKSYIFSNAGIFLDDLLYSKEYFKMSQQGKQFLDTLNSSGRIKAFGSLDVNSVLEKDDDGFRLKKFSQLGRALIDKTDQPTHRLLNEVLSDSVFTVENFAKCVLSSQPFEKIYCVGLSIDDIRDYENPALVEIEKDYVREYSATISLVSR